MFLSQDTGRGPCRPSASNENLGVCVCSTDLLLVTLFANKPILYVHCAVLLVHTQTYLYRWKEKMNLSEAELLSRAFQSTGETSQDLKPARYGDLGSTDRQPFW